MLEVECHISIIKEGVSFLNPLKVQLLKEIRKNGSLSGAAKNMKISYQYAWTLVEEMNRIAPYSLFLKQRGGAHGGGTAISDYGEQILMEYLMIQAKIKKLVDQINIEINL